MTFVHTLIRLPKSGRYQIRTTVTYAVVSPQMPVGTPESTIADLKAAQERNLATQIRNDAVNSSFTPRSTDAR